MAKLTILEGIPGSGKSTLLETMDGMKYYEGDLLLSWKHNLIPYITKTRIELFNHFLDRIEKHEGNVVLERFHLSLRLTDFRNDLTKTTYSKLIKRLSKLDTKTIIMTVPEKDVMKRAKHHERGREWEEYLIERIKYTKFTSEIDFLLDMQEQFIAMAREIPLPYEIVSR